MLVGVHESMFVCASVCLFVCACVLRVSVSVHGGASRNAFRTHLEWFERASRSGQTGGCFAVQVITQTHLYSSRSQSSEAWRFKGN